MIRDPKEGESALEHVSEGKRLKQRPKADDEKA
jgi:hypothetical protein